MFEQSVTFCSLLFFTFLLFFSWRDPGGGCCCWGGENNFYTWALGEPMYGFEETKSKNPYFDDFFKISKAHVLFYCPCIVCNYYVCIKGVTPHSEIIV